MTPWSVAWAAGNPGHPFNRSALRFGACPLNTGPAISLRFPPPGPKIENGRGGIVRNAPRFSELPANDKGGQKFDLIAAVDFPHGYGRDPRLIEQFQRIASERGVFRLYRAPSDPHSLGLSRAAFRVRRSWRAGVWRWGVEERPALVRRRMCMR